MISFGVWFGVWLDGDDDAAGSFDSVLLGGTQFLFFARVIYCDSRFALCPGFLRFL
jgi:hypothetical protein